jgi:hypothetical protein
MGYLVRVGTEREKGVEESSLAADKQNETNVTKFRLEINTEQTVKKAKGARASNPRPFIMPLKR